MSATSRSIAVGTVTWKYWRKLCVSGTWPPQRLTHWVSRPAGAPTKTCQGWSGLFTPFLPLYIRLFPVLPKRSVHPGGMSPRLLQRQRPHLWIQAHQRSVFQRASVRDESRQRGATWSFDSALLSQPQTSSKSSSL